MYKYLRLLTFKFSRISGNLSHVSNSCFVRKQCRRVVLVWGIIPMPPVYKMDWTDPSVVIWGPIFPINSFYPSSPLSLVLRKSKKTNATEFARWIVPICTLVHTTTFYHRVVRLFCLYGSLRCHSVTFIRMRRKRALFNRERAYFIETCKSWSDSSPVILLMLLVTYMYMFWVRIMD